jgi:hypothetical protein
MGLFLSLAGCAHRPLAVVLSFGVCPVTTRDGRDIDDGGSDVGAVVATDLSPTPRRLATTHFPGSICALEASAPGGLPAIACTDPHIDIRYILAWTRPGARKLVLERRQEPFGEAASEAPVRTPLGELKIERNTWINTAPVSGCSPSENR